MLQKIYLVSGQVSNGDLRPLDDRILSETSTKHVVVLNLTYTDPGKLTLRRVGFPDYSLSLGTDKV